MESVIKDILKNVLNGQIVYPNGQVVYPSAPMPTAASGRAAPSYSNPQDAGLVAGTGQAEEAGGTGEGMSAQTEGSETPREMIGAPPPPADARPYGHGRGLSLPDARRGIVLAEILGPPLCRRKRGR